MSEATAFFDEPQINTFAHTIGCRMVGWRDGYAELTLPVEPWLLNGAKVLHGGVITTLIDQAGIYAGVWDAVPRSRFWGATISLTSNLLAGVRAGTLVAVGQRDGFSKSMFSSTVTVRDDQDAIVATGRGLYRYLPGTGAAPAAGA